LQPTIAILTACPVAPLHGSCTVLSRTVLRGGRLRHVSDKSTAERALIQCRRRRWSTAARIDGCGVTAATGAACFISDAEGGANTAADVTSAARAVAAGTGVSISPASAPTTASTRPVSHDSSPQQQAQKDVGFGAGWEVKSGVATDVTVAHAGFAPSAGSSSTSSAAAPPKVLLPAPVRSPLVRSPTDSCVAAPDAGVGAGSMANGAILRLWTLRGHSVPGAVPFINLRGCGQWESARYSGT